MTDTRMLKTKDGRRVLVEIGDNNVAYVALYDSFTGIGSQLRTHELLKNLGWQFADSWKDISWEDELVLSVGYYIPDSESKESLFKYIEEQTCSTATV